MKISDLKKEILLVLLSASNENRRLRSLTADAIVSEINKKRPFLHFPGIKPLRVVCVKRSLDRLARDGLINVELSERLCLDSYYLNSRGKRKAEKVKNGISWFLDRWWNFINL